MAAASHQPGDAGGSRKRSWKKLQIDDEFLLGLEEPGFQEVEELDTGDVTLIGEDLKTIIERADAKLKTSRSKKKQNKAKKSKAAVLEGDATKEELLQRLAELEAENQQLKSSRPESDKQPSKKRKKKSSSQAGIAASASADVQADCDGAKQAADAEALDMSAWHDYGLESCVIDALADMKFQAPTAIQHECLPAAIQGNADLIGAAQTGSGKTLAFGLPIINFLVKEMQLAAELPADDAGDPPRDGSPDDEGFSLSGDEPGATRPLESIKAQRLRAGQKRLRALVLCPTRELAMQVCQHLTAVGKAVGVRVTPIVGGISPQKQERLLGYRSPIVVGTPGRLWDLMSSGHRHLSDLTYLSFLVLDEADRMVKQGHYAELNNILDQIPKPAGSGEDDAVDRSGEVVTTVRPVLQTKLRTYVFSATLMVPDNVKARNKGLSGSKGSGAGATFDDLMHRISFRGKPKIADLTKQNKLADKVSEAFVSCTEKEREECLYYILAMHPGRTIVFVNAVSGVRRLVAILKLLGLPAQALHAQQQQRQRLKALDRFRADSNGVLVATDVAARGLDVPGIACVVQYQLPPTADTYVHRAGRTARAEAEGLCVAFVVPAESARFAHLHRALGREPPPPFPIDSRVMQDVHARVRLAQRLDDLERVARKGKADRDWMKRHSAEIGFELDDDETDAGGEGKRGPSDDALAAQLRQELAAQLSKPLHPHINAKFFTGGASLLVAAAMSKEPHAGAAVSAAADAAGSHVPAGAMQSTLDTVQQMAAAGSALGPPPGADGRNAAPKRKQRNARVLTMAEHRAQALDRALQAKRMKKQGKKGNVGSAASGRSASGINALAALKQRSNA